MFEFEIDIGHPDRPHVPASDARLLAMKRCLVRTIEYAPSEFYQLVVVVREHLTAEERARFDAIPEEVRTGPLSGPAGSS